MYLSHVAGSCHAPGAMTMVGLLVVGTLGFGKDRDMVSVASGSKVERRISRSLRSTERREQT